jgi:hypothetical protein
MFATDQSDHLPHPRNNHDSNRNSPMMDISMSEAEPAQEAKDERIDPRTTVRRCGWLSRTRGEQLQECVVVDVSKKGARLAFNTPSEIPDNFYIYMTLESTSRRHCRVAWRSDKQIGVEFLD